MNSQPFFTIGIPIYNAAQYLSLSFGSVLSQSFSNYEILAVDDGSRDNSLEIVKEYAAKDSRIRIIEKANGGPAAGRNTMMYNAKGKYICFLDSDDAMCPEALQKAHDAIVKNNCPDILHAGFIRVVVDTETECACPYPGDEYFACGISKDERWAKLWLDGKTVDHICAKFFKTEFIRTAGLAMHTRLWAQEDNEFLEKCYRKADTMAYGDFFAFRYYKQRENSLSTAWSYKAVLGVLSRWADFYQDVELFDVTPQTKQRLFAEKQKMLVQLRSGTLGIAAKRSKEECFKLINMLDSYFGQDIKTMPVTESGVNGIIFRLYRIFGLKRTYRWLYAYLEKKGAVLKTTAKTTPSVTPYFREKRMEKQPFFTIGIPVYNTEKWVEQTLDSILCQSFDDFEIVCVDDGSRDGSLNILQSYAAKDNRIKVISKQNGGVSSARNAVLSAANGQYIYFIDSDDLMYPCCLQNAFDTLKQSDYPDLLETGYITRTPNGDIPYKTAYPGDKYFSPDLTRDERAVLMWLDTTYVPSVFAKFIKRQLITENNISFNPAYLVAEDCDFVFMLHRKMDTIAYGDFSACIYFNPRENSLTTKATPKSHHSYLCYHRDLFEGLGQLDLRDGFLSSNSAQLAARKEEFLYTAREKTLAVLTGSITKPDAMEIARTTQKFIGKELKNIPLPSDKFSGIIFRLYRIFGIPAVVSFLYDKRKSSGIITD